MTHLSLHRCRFVDYPPREITSLAFSHPSTPSSSRAPPKNLRLAIGRSNGSIEIWNPLSGAWHHETTLTGGVDRAIEGLCWTQDFDPSGHGRLRLFSIGYSSVITEWDLSTGCPRQHLDCSGGAIWSMCAQPRRNVASIPDAEREDEEAVAQKIVVGTDDGTLKIISTANGGLTFVKNLARAGPSKARVLSLAWRDRDTVVAGMADSRIRVWDIRSGRSVARMTLNRDKGREVLVWAVKVTKSGDVVSGDSKGEVCFWDGKNWTLKQRLKAHEADCLTLEVGGRNGDAVISGGADMRTVLMQVAGNTQRWGEVAKRRFHKHDVRAMAAYESGAFSVVVSGGVDMTPIIVPFRTFTTESHLVLPLVPQQPIISTLAEHRLLMSFWEREVKIWRIEDLRESPAGLDDGSGRKLLARIILSNTEFITSASLIALPNETGHLLAVSTMGEVKLFYLRNSKTGSALRIHKVPLPESLPVTRVSASDDEDSDDEEELDLEREGARKVEFTPDGTRLLIITPESRIFLLPLTITPTTPHPTISLPLAYSLPRPLPPTPGHSVINHNTIRTAKQKQDEGSHPDYPHTITHTSFTSTSSHLAVAAISGDINVYALTPEPEFIPNTIPRLSAAPSLISFRPGTAELLVLPADTQHIHLFDAETGHLAPWSARNPMPQCMPREFVRRDRVIGCWWEEGERVWCWSAGWVWMFDFTRDWPQHSLPSTSSALITSSEAGKRKRGGVVETGTAGAGAPRQNPMGVMAEEKRAAEETEDESEVEDDEDVDMEDGGVELQGKKRKGRAGRKPYWGSARYRGLLGCGMVGGVEEVKVGGAVVKSVEVVVVERPVWDVGLPPRFWDGKK